MFSNEAGLGSAPIAAAAAKTDHPSRQGYINMTGTFFDTLVICTLTGLAIAASGMLGQAAPDGRALSGAALTIAAFETGMGGLGRLVVTVSVALFAFSTLLGWEYYGEKCLEYLCGGSRLNAAYRAVYAVMIFLGALIAMDAVWYLSDTVNGLMAFPNLICLLVLSGVAARECDDFERRFVRAKRHKRGGA
ncbi:Amino-acid carrier protein AlsT [bioreactor metagenome]|uniref:Amino-acid carrier protein AlsT n=1 Tax=bioreactor metagenome TaxID=1076179 RepID=A0A645H540_9ZZZZ